MKLPFRATGQSCVWINCKEYPFHYGNYCYLKEYYCVNMWAENIQELNKRNPLIKDVEVKIFDNLCVVIDEQIPIEWRSSFCLTGSSGHSREIFEQLFNFLGRNDVNKWICGCEIINEKPHIIETVSFDKNNLSIRNYKCLKCKREWID